MIANPNIYDYRAQRLASKLNSREADRDRGVCVAAERFFNGMRPYTAEELRLVQWRHK